MRDSIVKDSDRDQVAIAVEYGILRQLTFEAQRSVHRTEHSGGSVESDSLSARVSRK